MTENGISTQSIAEQWAAKCAQKEAQKPTEPIAQQWEQRKAWLAENPSVQPLKGVTFTDDELSDFLDFRHRPNLASWGEFCANKGYSYEETISPLVHQKNQEHQASIVATYPPPR